MSDSQHKEIMTQLLDLNTRVSKLEGKMIASAAFFTVLFGLVGSWVSSVAK